MNKKYVSIAVASVVGALGASGLYWVTEKNAPPRRNINTTHEITELSDAPTSKKALERYKIGISFASLDSPFHLNEAYGILDEAKKAGVKVIWYDAEGRVDLQHQQVQKLVGQKVDAIILAPASYNIRSIVEPARQLGIPVFTHIYETEPAAVISSVRYDERDVGKAQAVALAQNLGGKGTVALLMSSTGANWLNQRADGFLTTLQQDFPNIKTVVERSIPTTKEAGFNTAKDLLPAFPELNAFYTASDIVAQGVADAVQEANRNEQTTVVTADLSRETMPYIADGRIAATIDTGAANMGRAVLNLAVQGLNGEMVPRQIVASTKVVSPDSIAAVKTDEYWAPLNWKPN